jgi:Rrf2 family protein
MQISRKADYALRAITFMVNQPENKRSSISEIAESEGIPRDFLAKILKELCRSGFLKSFQGVTGGYQLARAKSEISFLNVIEAMQGQVRVNMCVDQNGGCQCNHRTECTMLPFWQKIQKDVVQELSDITFDDPKFVREN